MEILGHGNKRAAKVVRFWRTVEMFSPQDVPRPTKGSGGQRVLDLGADELAPWQPGHPVLDERLPDGMTWQFTVYGGLFEVAAAQAALVNVFGQDSKPPDGRGGAGQTAMFAFGVDADGYLVDNSATLSACAWAISRLRSPGPGSPSWLDGFGGDEREFLDALNRLVPPKIGTQAPAGPASARVGSALTSRARDAAVEAVAAGAKEVGSVVGSAAGALVSSVSGSTVGGIADQVAGTFVERMLTPSSGTRPAPDGIGTRVPHLRLTARALHDFVAALSSALDLNGVLAPAGVRATCTPVRLRDGDEAGEQAFLNSFIANDLATIEQAVRSDDVGAGLRAYLADSRDIPTDARIDIRGDRDALVAGVAPAHNPGGRWPTVASKPLVISQQFAVNQIMRELGNGSGIFAVNGPPGTGKTTMLRDVLAAVVVERARKLADVRDPQDAFTEVIERVRLTNTYAAPVGGCGRN